MLKALVGTILLGVLLIIGALVTVPATQAQTVDTDGVPAVQPFTAVQTMVLAQVEDNLTMRYRSYHVTRGPYAPDTIEVTDVGTVLATWEEFRLPTAPDEGFSFYFDGDFDNRLPKSTPFNVALPPYNPLEQGMTYKITVEFGLGTPLVVVTPGRQIWYWQICHWEGCNEFGEGPHPPGDWHAQASYQSVGPDAFGLELYGCDSLLKQCTIDPVTNIESCPLVCIEPGWSLDVVPDDPNLYHLQ